MADVSFTATAVVPVTGTTNNTRISTGVAGATIAQGQPVEIDPTTGLLNPCLNSGTQAQANCAGIALASVAVNQPVSYAVGGDLTLGSGLTRGTVYVVSTNSGKIAPTSDLASGNYVTVLGMGYSSSVLRLGILVGTIQV